MNDGAVRRLFLRALDLAPEARAAFLDSSSAAPDVRAAVLTLLRYDAGSETFLQQAVSSERPLVPDGERFGPYQLGPLLGRGGMGAVFRAERVDGELHQTVAIKIVERGWLDPRAFERFRVERQILASLVHPNIARLLDGGTREDGLPYLVMEFVDGLRLDQYCDQHALPLAARLRIFLPLCDAVDYAHRKLIVHRDLKPANVLVTAEGVPKLLDFGVARVLDTGFDARTQTLVLTPGFASPEQVRGEEVTTASDVYGLGAVLYHLLTGRAPHAVENLSPYELQRAICETPPTPAGEIRPELRGDVQNILLKALDPEPAARYGSVTALADDLRRYLNHEPVSARPGTFAYRAAKFIRRNRAPVGLTVAALTLVIASLSAGLYAANRQRRVAERRFIQVRQLANKFIDLDESIRVLPGATAVRKSIVSDALQYLTSLGSEVHGDKDLGLEIALAYVRVAHVLGDPTSPNLGQFADAETTLAKAAGFVDAVLAMDGKNQLGWAIKATIAHDRMQLAFAQHRWAESLVLAGKTAEQVERVMHLDNLNSEYLYGLSYFDHNAAEVCADHRHFDDAIRLLRRALDISRRAQWSRELEGNIAGVFTLVLWQTGALDEALTYSYRAVELTEEAAAVGVDTVRRGNLARALVNEGVLLGGEDAAPSLGRTADALAKLQRGMDMAQELASKDSGDSRSSRYAVIAGREMGNILRHSDPRTALAIYDRALARSRKAAANAVAAGLEEELLAGSSYPMHRTGRDGEARQRLDRALQLLRDAGEYPAEKVEPMSALDHVLRAVADEDLVTGQTNNALAAYRELLSKLMAWKPDMENDLRDATCISRTWTALAGLLRRAGRGEEAARLEAQRADLWNHWKRKLPNGEFLMRQSLRQAWEVGSVRR